MFVISVKKQFIILINFQLYEIHYKIKTLFNSIDLVTLFNINIKSMLVRNRCKWKKFKEYCIRRLSLRNCIFEMVYQDLKIFLLAY